MKEGVKRSIYNELRTHDVVKSEKKSMIGFFECWQYTFGHYRIYEYWDHIRIHELNPKNECFVIMDDAEWSDECPHNTTYEICTAVKNKLEGKPYIDPYNRTKRATIKDTTRGFDDNMSKNANDFLPYDVSKELRVKIITEMKRVLINNLERHYTKQK